MDKYEGFTIQGVIAALGTKDDQLAIATLLHFKDMAEKTISLTQSEETLKAKVAALEKIIEEAPHHFCAYQITTNRNKPETCDCWKSRARVNER